MRLPLLCYARGTAVLTAHGERPVETVREGDLIQTADAGLQPVIWVASSRSSGFGNHAPIRIAAGTMGARADVYVSPQHRLLLEGPEAELFYGEAEVFTPAKSLLNGEDIAWAPCRNVEYFHVMLPEHHVIFAAGLASESFYPGDQARRGLSDKSLREKFPQLWCEPEEYGPTARRTLRSFETAPLVRSSKGMTWARQRSDMPWVKALV